MSKFIGNQYIYGEVYISGIGNLGLDGSGGCLQDAVNERVLTITSDNIDAYDYDNVVEMDMMPIHIDYSGGVQFQYMSSDYDYVSPPTAGNAVLPGTELTIFNLQSLPIIIKGSGTGSEIVISSQDNFGYVKSYVNLGFLKAVTIKAVHFPASLRLYGEYAWIVVSKTSIN